MIKISNHKFLICVLALMLLGLCSCGNSYTTMTDGVTIHVSDNLKEYFLYQDDLPSLHFDYNNVNVMIESEGAACFFVKNNQYELSDKFAEHLSRYSEDQIYVVSESLQTYDSGTARFGSDKLTLDQYDEDGNEQTNSKEYQIVCTDLDGTRYSYQYRTFVSEGKRYYIYRYSSNMGISLEQSLMVVKDDEGNNKLLLIALPFNTKYEVSGSSLSVKSLINKDTYVAERYSKYAYPTYLDGLTEDEKIVSIKEWYTTYCNGYETTENDFVFSYAGAKYKVLFGITDASQTQDQNGFQLIYLGKN